MCYQAAKSGAIIYITITPTKSERLGDSLANGFQRFLSRRTFNHHRPVFENEGVCRIFLREMAVPEGYPTVLPTRPSSMSFPFREGDSPPRPKPTPLRGGCGYLARLVQNMVP